MDGREDVCLGSLIGIPAAPAWGLTGVVKGEGAQQHHQQQDAAGPHIHAAPIVANLRQCTRGDV